MAMVGALPVAFVGGISQRFLNPVLGFAAGVMLAATVFSLVQPGIEEAGGDLYGAFVMIAGICSVGSSWTSSTGASPTNTSSRVVKAQTAD
jgi:zinc transporter ZupT